MEDKMQYITQFLHSKDNVLCDIYLITNKINGKQYVGQAATHRLNMGRYKPFGFLGRFRDHISEAICNSKKKQCSFLNNAIRKYGKDAFIVELLTRCELDKSNEEEIHFIKLLDTLYPKGYNLTSGGKVGNVLPHQKELAMKNTHKQFADKKLAKFKDVAHHVDIGNLNKYISRYTSYGEVYFKVQVENKRCIFVGQYMTENELKKMAEDFLKTLAQIHLATLPNCGNIPESSNTTSLVKASEGTRVMTGSNGNNLDGWTIRSQAPKIKVKLKSKSP